MASPLIARYCGDVGYTELTSSGTHVLLHFVSDGVIDEAQLGFQLQHIGESKNSFRTTKSRCLLPEADRRSFKMILEILLASNIRLVVLASLAVQRK